MTDCYFCSAIGLVGCCDGDGYPAGFVCRATEECSVCNTTVGCVGLQHNCWKNNYHMHEADKDEGTVCHHYHGELLEKETGVCTTHFNFWTGPQPAKPKKVLYDF